MKECNSDLALVRAQVGLAFFFATCFMACLMTLMYFHSQMSPQEETIVVGLVSVLGTIVVQQSNYFFARQRPHVATDDGAIPNPLVQPLGNPPAKQE